eukprot:TRINITY_DN4968_c0_g1_i1.p1 TRINITY_DN4968_c0_g1~~TRINITY_DN4968_c0_g1_i1.p1  ORF type:complete len:811 (-),score=171.01 TRINITY_DN4968_c0_g1_i1:1917-4349(-)
MMADMVRDSVNNALRPIAQEVDTLINSTSGNQTQAGLLPSATSGLSATRLCRPHLSRQMCTFVGCCIFVDNTCLPRTRQDDDVCPSWSASPVQMNAQEVCEGKNWSSEECSWFGCCTHSGSECKSNRQNASCMPSQEIFTDVPSTSRAPASSTIASSDSTTGSGRNSTALSTSGIANDTMDNPMKPSSTPAAKVDVPAPRVRGRAKVPAYMAPVLSPGQRKGPVADANNTQSVPWTSSRPSAKNRKTTQPKAGRGKFPDDWKKDVVDAIRDAMKEAAKDVLGKHLEKSGYPIKKQAVKAAAEKDNKPMEKQAVKAAAEKDNKPMEKQAEEAGAEQDSKKDKACKDVAGKYMQIGRASKLLIIKQVGCSINATVNERYIGGGQINGDDIKLMGWSVGNVTQNGTLRFADGSLWSQSTTQVALPPGHGQLTIKFDGVKLQDLGLDNEALAAKLRQKMTDQGLLPTHHAKLSVNVQGGLLEFGLLALFEGVEEDPSITVIFTAPHEVLDKIRPMDLSISGRVPRIVAAEDQGNYTSKRSNSSSKLVDAPMTHPEPENFSSLINETFQNEHWSTPVADKDSENTTLTTGGDSGGSASTGGDDSGHNGSVTKITKIVKNRPVIDKGTEGSSGSGSSSSSSSAGSVSGGSFDVGSNSSGANAERSEGSRGSSGQQVTNAASSSTETKNSDNTGIIVTIVILSVMWVGLCAYAARHAMTSQSDEAAAPLQEAAAATNIQEVPAAAPAASAVAEPPAPASAAQADAPASAPAPSAPAPPPAAAAPPPVAAQTDAGADEEESSEEEDITGGRGAKDLRL